MFVFGIKLLRRPAYDLTKLLWDICRLLAGHLVQNGNLTVTQDKVHWNLEAQKVSECFRWHRTRNNIPSNHNMIYACLTDLFDYCLKCGEIPVDVIDCGDRHNTREDVRKRRRSPSYRSSSTFSSSMRFMLYWAP